MFSLIENSCPILRAFLIQTLVGPQHCSSPGVPRAREPGSSPGFAT